MKPLKGAVAVCNTEVSRRALLNTGVGEKYYSGHTEVKWNGSGVGVLSKQKGKGQKKKMKLRECI